MQLPDGMQLPEGMPRPDGDAAGGRGRPGGLGGNKLKERFLASAAFKPVYEDAYRDLYQKIYADGTALNAIESITKVLSTVDGYDEQKTTADVEQLKTLLRQRTSHLATDSVITSG
ncbi:hypothetical protein [Plantactinospora sp. B24E8]|uniref:hypothetical protein n=1 Tax=Plantactinospora sp. B24E8 TaxID=3153567 RepID=UPI00325EDE33